MMAARPADGSDGGSVGRQEWAECGRTRPLLALSVDLRGPLLRPLLGGKANLFCST